MALDWPLVAIGSCSGGVFLANIASGALIARSAEDAHPRLVEGQAAEMELLHGAHDGGGVTAIAFDGSRVVSGGRDAVARVWLYTPGEAVLAPVATLPCAGVVTAAVLEEVALPCVPFSVQLYDTQSAGLVPCISAPGLCWNK